MYHCNVRAEQEEICDDKQLVRLAKGFRQWTKEGSKICACELSCVDKDISIVSTIKYKVPDIRHTKYVVNTYTSNMYAGR